jgi:hypothetical protein
MQAPPDGSASHPLDEHLHAEMKVNGTGTIDVNLDRGLIG